MTKNDLLGMVRQLLFQGRSDEVYAALADAFEEAGDREAADTLRGSMREEVRDKAAAHWAGLVLEDAGSGGCEEEVRCLVRRVLDHEPGAVVEFAWRADHPGREDDEDCWEVVATDLNGAKDVWTYGSEEEARGRAEHLEDSYAGTSCEVRRMG